MKSVSERLEHQMHQLARKKVQSCTQPGVVLNIIEKEMNVFLTDILNQKLQKDQADLLGRVPYERNGDGRKRNGSKPFRLNGFFSRIILKRPVLRGKTPVSPTLSLIRKFGKGMIGAICSRFWLRGTSTRAVADELNQAFGTRLHSSDISGFSSELLPEIQAWLERPITAAITYVFLDACYLSFRKPGFTTDQALLCAIGIGKDGTKHVLGFLLGDREDTDTWKNLLKDLLRRGLDRNAIAMAISDDHKAIEAAVQNILGVSHQRCVIHKMRNVLARVSQKHREEFYADFKAIYWANTKEEAFRAIGKLQTKWERLYPKAAQIACDRPTAFLQFMEQPKDWWTILRSSNFIERFIRELKRRLYSAGAMQSEGELWKLTGTVSIEQERRWMKRKLKTNIVKEQKQAA